MKLKIQIENFRWCIWVSSYFTSRDMRARVLHITFSYANNIFRKVSIKKKMSIYSSLSIDNVIYLYFPLLLCYKFFDESSMSSPRFVFFFFLYIFYLTKDNFDIKMNVITFYCLASKCDAIYFYVFYLYSKSVQRNTGLHSPISS